MPKLTNKNLRELLIALGFQAGGVEAKNHRAFQHLPSGCILLLPDNKSDEAPRPADLIGVKAQLAAQGILEEDAFEYFIAHASPSANT
jgi:hypothetical protein